MSEFLPIDQSVPEEGPLFDAIAAQLKSTQKFSASGTPDELEHQLLIVGQIDRKFQNSQSFWTMVAIGCGIGTFASIFLLVMTSGYSAPLTILLVAGAIFSIVKAVRSSKLNVTDRRHIIPRHLLASLARDMHPSIPVTLEIDFSSHDQSKYSTGKTGGGLFDSVRVRTFRQPWLSIRGQFMDGNSFRLRTTSGVKEKRKSKRKGHKTTNTFSDRFTLMIDVNPERYVGLERLANAGQKKTAKSQPVDDAVTLDLSGAPYHHSPKLNPKFRVDGNRVVATGIGNPFRVVNNRGSVSGAMSTESRDVIEFFRLVYGALLACHVKSQAG